MNLIEFKKKKYWEGFVDLKKLTKEFRENERMKREYNTLNKFKSKNTFRLNYLTKNIIW
jgi:hypothetical protein